MTQLKHLKCLSAVKSTANISFLTPAAFPGTHCPMHTALAMGTKIRGVSTLVVGTNECGMYSRNIPAASLYSGEALHWSYILDGNEVVFGCREGLSRAILEMNSAGANVILLLSTCVPEVIGEDMEAIARALAPQMTARLITVPLGNFKCLSYQPGYWQTLLAMSTLIEPCLVRSKVLNILGRSPNEDHTPMPELLKSLKAQGVPLRFLAPDASVNDFRKAGDAVLNLVLSPFLRPLAQWMKDKLDMPFFSLHDIYAPADILEVYQKISHVMNIEFNFSDEHERALSIQRQLSSAVSGKSCIYTNIGATQPLPLAAYLSSLGLHPALIHMEDFYPSDMIWRQVLLDLGDNPPVCLMVNEEADRGVIDALSPDLVIGDWGGRSGKIPGVPFLMDLYGQIGYERTTILLERVIKAGRQSEHGTI